MSIKIYSGYKIKIRPSKLLDFCKKVKDLLFPYIDNTCIDIVHYFEYYYEVKKLLNFDVDYQDIRKYTRTVCEHYKFQLCLFPRSNDVLCIFFGVPSLQELFEKMEDVQYYGYWNNTDPDEDCSEEEWEQRGKDWEIVSYGPLCEQSLIYEPFPSWWCSYPQSYYEHKLDLVKLRYNTMQKIVLDIIKNDFKILESTQNLEIANKVAKRAQWMIPLDYNFKRTIRKKAINNKSKERIHKIISKFLTNKT